MGSSLQRAWARLRAEVFEAVRDANYSAGRLAELQQVRVSTSPDPLRWGRTWMGTDRLVGSVIPEQRRGPA